MKQLLLTRKGTGFCVWLTGLPAAGKSTIAEALASRLRQLGRKITVLDGDVVRTHISKGLGYSREDRDANVCRIGFVASQITYHEGAVICAVISPYESTRSKVREMFEDGKFFLAYVNTSLEVCRQRDPKGLYARAREGKLHNVTGVDDPYEVPKSPDWILTTEDVTPDQNALRIILRLIEKGVL